MQRTTKHTTNTARNTNTTTIANAAHTANATSTAQKVLSIFLAIVLVFSLTPHSAYAEIEEANAGTAESVTETASNEAGTSANEEATITTEETASVNIANNAANTTNTTSTAPSATTSTIDATNNLAYVYIQTPEASTDTETQNIVVGLNSTNQVQSATLTIHNTSTNSHKEIALTKAVEGALLFSFSPSTMGEGNIELVSLTYTLQNSNEALYEISFAQGGVEVEVSEVTTDEEFPEEGLVALSALNSEGISLQSSANTTYSFETTNTNTTTNAGTHSSDGIQTLADEGITTTSLDSLVDESISDDVTSTMYAEEGISLMSSTDDGMPVIVLDPGHGGTETGARANGVTEKEVNLKIAQYCKEELDKDGGYIVYMTRTGDYNVSLSDRYTMAANWGADVEVSFHNDYASSASASGASVIVPAPTTYYYNETYVVANALGEKILANIAALGLPTRYVYYRYTTVDEHWPDGSLSDYYALVRGPRSYGIPGIIVEHAFVSNEGDAANLKNESILRALGIADAQGIMAQFPSNAEPAYALVYNYDYYIANNPDVAAAFGGNRKATFRHFLQYGMNEGRNGNSLFDLAYYKSHYADLQAAFGNDNKSYFKHFIDSGVNEGRRAGTSFDVSSYYNENPDLRAAYGHDLKSYYLHYLVYGASEGRAGTGCTSLVGYTSTFEGVDYSVVYDGAYYASNNADVVANATFSTDFVSLVDDATLIKHFVCFGMNEDRRGNTFFDLSYYKSQYPDLQVAFGTNNQQYYSHFVFFGMNEGRNPNANFDIASYFNANIDLRRAFEVNLPAYYKHYLECGINEGRTTTGCSSLQNIVTSFDGFDYSLVYDPIYYANNNADLKAAACITTSYVTLYNDVMLMGHFVIFGMNEQRQAIASFNVKSYYYEYADLRAAFGANWPAYYRHYVEFGAGEGRHGTGYVYSSENIMGPSMATAAQMASCFNSTGKVYPSGVYAQYGAASIHDFCQIILEEANMEGVRAEVVFAQAMYETGWLQFGGDVQAYQCNFAGIGATGGVPGNSFNDWGANSVRKGIRAQVQHLKAYAATTGKEALANECVDPRFDYVSPHGKATTVYALGGTWAVGSGASAYGTGLMNIMNRVLAS